MFGRTGSVPFNGKALQDRADTAWKNPGLERITPHVRLADDRRGGQRQGAVDVHGHSTIAVTLDLYGPLMPGSEVEAAGLLDTYLATQRGTRRGGGPRRWRVSDWRTNWRTDGERFRQTAWISGHAYPIRSRIGISWICGGWRWSQRIPRGRG